jgi:hypothetical protein
MILRLLRRRARTRLAATLLSLAVCGAAVNWGHTGGDDPGCDPALVLQGQAPAHVGAPSAAASPTDHCPLCHFLRIFQTAVSAKSFQATGVSSAAASPSLDHVLAPSLLALNVSSRAPPAILL